MKRYALLIVLFFCSRHGIAQSAAQVSYDTLYAVPLKEVDIAARWKNDTERYRYNQMRFYVTTVLPYVNAATKLFTDINAKEDDPQCTRRDKRKYIDVREDEVRTKFEKEIKGLNVTQGVLLVKLIERQTNINIYKMLQQFRNPFTAIKWQTWARLNGMNLDRKYDPAEERDLEHIMESLGYPLPNSYAVNTTE